MKFAIIIPARYGSTRFPGKPLALINGRPMIDHVCDLARQAADSVKDARVIVATDDDRIERHCRARDVDVLRTSPDCATGSDRVLEAVVKLSVQPDIVVNLQGDAPLTPLEALEGVMQAFTANPDINVATVVKQLDWSELGAMRRKKELTPFSGTTAVLDRHDRAIWFSKMILPAIRNENERMAEDGLSPVFQHLGLYAYRFEILRRYVNLKPGHYETLEGLEQLRFLENDIPVHCIRLNPGCFIHSGIDSPEDVDSAEAALRRIRAGEGRRAMS